MKITKDDLKKMIAEEMANEGILDMFGLGSGDKKAALGLGRNLYLKIRNADMKGELDKFAKLSDQVNTVALDIQRQGLADDPDIVKIFGDDGKLANALGNLRAKVDASSEESAQAAAAEKEKSDAAEKARLDKDWREKQPSLPRDPKYVHRHPGFSVAAEGKITKSELEQIIREEFEAVLGEGEYRSDPRMDTHPDDEQLRGYPLEPDAGGSDWFIPGTTTGEKAPPEIQKMLRARRQRHR